MAYFQAKNSNFSKFSKALQWKMMALLWSFCTFTAKWYILWPNGIIYGQMVYFVGHLVHFVGHLVHFSRFGMLYREKSGNPG
jgi:hypothetical protein